MSTSVSQSAGTKLDISSSKTGSVSDSVHASVIKHDPLPETHVTSARKPPTELHIAHRRSRSELTTLMGMFLY